MIRNGTHKKLCVDCKCEFNEEPHAVTFTDYSDGNNTVTCIMCNVILDKNNGAFIVNNINGLPRTNAGSYILPNGIVILVEEDIQAYKEGTLAFNDANSEII